MSTARQVRKAWSYVDLDVRRRAIALLHDDRTLGNLAVAALVIAAHALVIASVLTGDSKSNSNRNLLGAQSIIHGVILEVTSANSFPKKPRLSPPSLRAIEFNSDHSARVRHLTTKNMSPTAEKPGLVVLSGRYLGQIQARIERAWRRPRSAIGSNLFRCQVQIDQRRNGQVGDITLQRCNGTMQWQESLVRAIDDASPLSAPPNPAVFSHHLILVFRSMGYTHGAPSGEFEPPAAPAEREDSTPLIALTQVDALRARPGARSGKHSVIELNIAGSQVHVVIKNK